MSWITSAKCFNGLVCIGDIQATITYSTGDIKYINCIQKVYNIYDNLVVGFAGDIKVALLMIEKLKNLLSIWLEKDTLFDVDGQLYELRENLKLLYNEFRGNSFPKVELLFCWYAQDENEYKWNLYNWKFISPNFAHSGDGKIQSPIQIGSGNNNENYQNSLKFLTGDQNKRSLKFEKIFKSNPEMIIWTISKYKNFLINQARQENFNGVSKSFHSFVATINYDKLYSKEDNDKIKEISRKFGLEFQPITHDSDTIHGVEFSVAKLKCMADNHPKKFYEIWKEIEEINKRINIASIYEKPIFTKEFHESNDEMIDTICTSWKEFDILMKTKYKVTIGTVATATG